MTLILTAGDALLAEIIASPADDVPRLIYADWLDEQGQSLRAEIIRVQIEIAGMAGDIPDNCRPRWTELCSREKKLLTPGHFWDWFGLESDGRIRAWPGSPGVRIRGNVFEVGYFAGSPPGGLKPSGGVWKLTMTRGFLSGWEMLQEDWLKHGPQLVRQHPIEVVRLPGLFHKWDGGEVRVDHGEVDERLWQLMFPDLQLPVGMPFYVHDLPSTLQDRLSCAALTWARSQEVSS